MLNNYDIIISIIILPGGGTGGLSMIRIAVGWGRGRTMGYGGSTR